VKVIAPCVDCTATATVPFFAGFVVGGTVAFFDAVPLFVHVHG
jgi:hypothetical protein